ncbi:hypothetical protein RIR_jg16275.t1 [Rhizophagus irregularis DAOM 181602=DAOM 197198]|nr:hypothetical protein RIR_jg16275.t1 [Rhizophagus irregularis DAOM 181602=DAOM 197198]
MMITIQPKEWIIQVHFFCYNNQATDEQEVLELCKLNCYGEDNNFFLIHVRTKSTLHLTFNYISISKSAEPYCPNRMIINL